MSYYLITFRSLTHAQRAAVLLERAGLTVTVRKAPAGLSKSGCAYAVVLRKDHDTAREVLKKYGLFDGKIFYRTESGEYREE